LVVDRCRGLSKVWYSGEGCDLHGLLLVLLESAKDLFLGVDPPGEPMPPSVLYGIAWLIIRNTLASVSYFVKWRGIVTTSLFPPSAKGAIAMGILSNATVLQIPYQSQMSYLE
jgi:hypothetical protein